MEKAKSARLHEISELEADEDVEVYTLTPDVPGIRLDQFFADACGISRSRVSKLIEAGYAYSKNATIKKSDRTGTDPVTLFVPPPEELSAKPENIPLDVVYEDEDLIVVNKPQGMVVHPAAGNPNHTLVNALLYHCKASLSGIGGVLRPGIVHRIDKDTSGLLMVAKTDKAHLFLANQIKNHDFSRKYLAILYGNPKEDCGKVHTAIGRNIKDRKQMAVFSLGTPNTKEAITEYRVLERFKGFCLAEFTLFTGRTHQIRVHAKHLGHPVVGDPLYAPGRDACGFCGQALCAYHLSFTHPESGKELSFTIEPPENFKRFLEEKRKESYAETL